MDTRKVWATILIVLGVLFVLGGIAGYYDTSFYGNEIESTGNTRVPGTYDRAWQSG